MPKGPLWWRGIFLTRTEISRFFLAAEAEVASYTAIEPAFELGDPQTDGQGSVPTEVSFTFNKLNNITGLKAEITVRQDRSNKSFYSSI